jgi:hypothetical protein
MSPLNVRLILCRNMVMSVIVVSAVELPRCFVMLFGDVLYSLSVGVFKYNIVILSFFYEIYIGNVSFFNQV